MEQQILLFVLFAFLAIMFLIGLWSSKKMSQSKTSFLDEYFLGGREMGGLVLAMTMAATYASAGSFIGGPGTAYAMGLGWVLLAMTQLCTGYIVLAVLGKRFAIIGRKVNATTVVDILKERYDSKAVVILSSLGILGFFIAAVAVQFIGGARLLQSVTGLSYQYGLIIFAVVIIFYVTVGGFRAVAVTDTIQGLIMFVGTAILLIAAFNYGGGVSSIMGKLNAINPDMITPFGPGNFIAVPWVLSFWVLVGFGVIGLPQVAVRGLAFKDSKAMHRAMIISTIVTGFFMLGMHLAGAIGQALVPDIAVADTVIPELSMKIMNPWVAGIFLAAPLVAIMSTVDSQLLVVSSTVVKDLYINYINPQVEDAYVKKLSLSVTAIVGAIVFAFSFNPPEFLVWLNLFALAGMETVFLWPIILGIYWKRANSAGAIASILIGTGTYMIFNSYWPRPFGTHTIILPLVLALAAFVLTSSLTAPPSQETLKKFWGLQRQG